MKKNLLCFAFAVILTLTSVFGMSGCFHKHTVEIDAEVLATCHSEGKTEGSHCSECGEVIEEQTPIPMIEHTPVIDAAVEVSCSVEGKSEGSHCSVCNAVLVAQETVEKLPHTPMTDEAVASTCTVEGKTEGTHCSVCNEVIIEQKVVEVLPHTVVIVEAVNATCISEGSTEWEYCSVCDTVIKEKTVLPKTDHTVVTDPAVEATCSSVGYTEGSHCSVCNEVFKARETVEKTAHKPVTLDEIKSTCITEGRSALTECSVCGEYIGGGIKWGKGPHTYVKVSGSAATCSKAGLSDGYTCSVCNAVVTAQKETPKIPHNFNGNKCSDCGFVRNVNGATAQGTGLTLANLLNKNISIIRDMTLLSGTNIELGFKNMSMADSKVYYTESDVLGYPCKIYVQTTADSRSIFGVYCYAEMGILQTKTVLDDATLTKHTSKTMTAFTSIYNTFKNNTNATTDRIENIFGIFSSDPRIEDLKFEDIYEKVYIRYMAGHPDRGGIICVTGRFQPDQYKDLEYRLYIADYSTDGGWYLLGNCIVFEF